MEEINIVPTYFGTLNPELDRILNEHTIKSLGHPLAEAKKIGFALMVEEEIVGGITGTLNANECHVNALAIKESQRKSGCGGKLLERIETEAKKEGAKLMTLSTLSYQALDFYKKQGYQLIGELADCPFDGVTKYFLMKRLG